MPPNTASTVLAHHQVQDRRVNWTSYIAIGDSFSEGLADPQREVDNAFHGWTDRLAHILALDAATRGQEFRYANLAIRGRLIDRILDEQLPAALAQQPELISIVGGGNDLLRPNGDPDRLAARLEAAVVSAREAGVDVLMATPTDTRDAGVFSLMRNKNAIYTANIWSIARRHGAFVTDAWGLRSIQDWRMWAPDRIHLTAEGHHRVAAAAATALGITVDAEGLHPLEPAAAQSRREAARESREWASSHFAPWLKRRITRTSSGDGITAKRPQLTVLDPADAPPLPQF